MDGISIIFYYEACKRALTFFSYSSHSLFDPRWLSGNWGDMHLSPSNIDLPSHIQDLPGEIETGLVIGPFNLSTKFSSMKVRIINDERLKP